MSIKLLCKDVDIIWEAIEIDTSRCWNQFIAYYRLMSCDPPKRFSHDEIVARTEVNACDRLAQPPQPHNVFSSTEELLWKSVPEVVPTVDQCLPKSLKGLRWVDLLSQSSSQFIPNVFDGIQVWWKGRPIHDVDTGFRKILRVNNAVWGVALSCSNVNPGPCCCMNGSSSGDNTWSR